MARFTNDMDSFGQGLNTLLSKVIREPLRIVACLAGALWFNWRLTCLTLIAGARSRRCDDLPRRQDHEAGRAAVAGEHVEHLQDPPGDASRGSRSSRRSRWSGVERRRFFLETKSLYRKSVRVAMIDAMSDPVLEMLALITVTIALLAGLVPGAQAARSSWTSACSSSSSRREPMTIEDLLTLYAMLAGVSDPIRKLSNVHSKIQRAAAAADRICALMDREPQVVDKPSAPSSLPRHRRTIEFDDVALRLPRPRRRCCEGLT